MFRNIVTGASKSAGAAIFREITMLRGLARLLTVFCLAGLLAACGGSGNTEESTLIGTPGSGGDGDGTTPDPTPSIVLVLVDSDSNPVTSLSGSDTAFAQATVLDSDGNVVPGVVVTFTTEVGTISPASGTDLSDALGVATVVIGTGTTEGAGNVIATATVEGVEATSNFLAFESDGTGSDGVTSANFTVAIDLTTEDPDDPTISRDNEGTVTVTITDINNPTDPSGIEGVVNFTITSGVLTETAVAIVDGVATTTLLSGINPGSGTVSASVTIGGLDLASDTIAFATSGDGVSTLTLSVSGDSGTATAPPSSRAAIGVVDTVDTATNISVTATLLDSRGEPVSGALVSFNLQGSGRLSSSSALSTSAGTATTTILPGTVAGFGTITASAAFDNVIVESEPSTDVAFETAGDEPFTGEGSSNLVIEIGLDNDNTTEDADGNVVTDDAERTVSSPTVTTLFARVTQNGDPNEPIGNVIVQFVTSPDDVGVLFPANGLTLTGDDGYAVATLTAGTIAGAGTATASIVIDNATFDADSITYSSLGNEEGTVVPSVSLTFDGVPADEATPVVTLNNPGSIGVRIEDEEGTLLPNRTVQVSTSVGTVSATGVDEAQTISFVSQDGTASIDLLAPDTIDNGQVQVQVGSVQAFLSFEVGIDSLKLGTCTGGTGPTDCDGNTFTDAEGSQMEFGTTSLSALGNTTVSLVVVQDNDTPVANVDLTVTSTCASQTPALADLPSTVTSDSLGRIVFDYDDLGCGQVDTIQVTEESTNTVARGELEVRTIAVGSIRFVSVDPADIQIKGSGTSTSSVVFQVLDVEGNPVEDASVTFGLTTKVGGLSLVGESEDPDDADCDPTNSATINDPDCTILPSIGITDANGNVTATVNAGFIPTTVRVSAAVDVDLDGDGDFDDDNLTLETLSDGLSVNTGIPDQNSFSMSATELNIEGDDFDGEQSLINVRLADGFNNPVPDGTTVQFRTEYGSIVSSCDTVGGVCSVLLTSQAPRNPNDPDNPATRFSNTSCPTELIVDEVVAGAATIDTDYVPKEIYRVETAGEVGLANPADWSPSANAKIVVRPPSGCPSPPG